MKHNLAQIGAELSAINDTHTSTIVCLKDVTGKNFRKFDEYEIETMNLVSPYYGLRIELSSSNYANTIINNWP